MLRDIVKAKKFAIVNDLRAVPTLVTLAFKLSKTPSIPASQTPVLFQYLNHLLKQEAGDGRAVNVVSLMADSQEEEKENALGISLFELQC